MQTSLLLLLSCVGLNCAVPSHHRQRRIVGGMEAAVPPEDDPVVFVYKDDHSARVAGVHEDLGNYYAFRGIRFAEPPMGRYRFQRPRGVRLEGDINATESGPPCPQPHPTDDNITMGHEDCLFLNVFTPELADGTDGLPVLLWIHGGGFRRGSAAQYGARHLVNKKLVVVAIQYRLGSLGFLSTGTSELPGNAGMFDMALALEWVRDYISFFGGNPLRVMAFGQGTGASSAILLSLSQLTQGFLGGVLAMSGSALSTFAVDHNPLATGRDLAQRNGCPDSPVLEMVKCLQELPVSTLIQADSGLQAWRVTAQGLLASLTGLLGAAPVVEGSNDERFLPNFLEESPHHSLLSGKFPHIPLLTGVTKDETYNLLLGKSKADILDKIKSIPGFDNHFIKDLYERSGISTLTNKTQDLIQHLSEYLGHQEKNPLNIIHRLVEVTGDALFNLPAFQTANMWSKKAPTFLYSFEHKGTNKDASKFLAGSPLVQEGNVTTDQPDHTGVGHGDDLPFVFDYVPIDGSTSPRGLSDPDDIQVQDIMMNLIADFARTGNPHLSTEEGPKRWPKFSDASSDFLTISTKPKFSRDFRHCQMALWTGEFAKLQSSACQMFGGISKVGEEVLQAIHNGSTALVNPLDKLSAGVANALEDAGSKMESHVVGGKQANPIRTNIFGSPKRIPIIG